MSLVENIKQLCDSNGISIPKLEKELGLAKGSIYKWDEVSPSINKVQGIADHFKVSVDSVIGRESFSKSNSQKLSSIINTLLVRIDESVSKSEIPDNKTLESLKMLYEIKAYQIEGR